MDKLPIKQMNFADNWIETGNATESYKNAGYKYSSENIASVEGHKLLRNPKVRAYVEERLKEIKSENIASQQEILESLTSILRGTKTGVALVGAGKGFQDVVEVEPTVQEKIKAAELLGKRYTMWTDKQEISGDVSVTFVDDIGSDLNDN